MFSYALSTGTPSHRQPEPCLTLAASTYFHLPIDEDEDKDIENYERKYITWVAEPSGSATKAATEPTPAATAPDPDDPATSRRQRSPWRTNDLYLVLGVDRRATLDKMSLRRAYLSRSRTCHPECVLPIAPFLQLIIRSKFPDNPDATRAFQKVAVAYDVLSTPHLRRPVRRPPTERRVRRLRCAPDGTRGGHLPRCRTWGVQRFPGWGP